MDKLNLDVLSYGLIAVGVILPIQWIIISCLAFFRVQKEIWRILIIVPVSILSLAAIGVALVIPAMHFFG